MLKSRDMQRLSAQQGCRSENIDPPEMRKEEDIFLMALGKVTCSKAGLSTSQWSSVK